MKQQSGFTLIELIVVIVILGILAATALPKFINLSDDARTAAIQGVAGGLNAANAINYGGCSVTAGVHTANKCVAVTKCSDVGTLMQPTMVIGTASSFTIPYLTADTAVAVGVTATCTINEDKSVAGDKVFTTTYTVTGA